MTNPDENKERIERKLVPMHFECLSCYDTGLGFSREGDEVFREPCYCKAGRSMLPMQYNTRKNNPEKNS